MIANGRRGVHHRKQASSISETQAAADRQADQIAIPMHVCMLGPEIPYVGLLGRAENAVDPPIVARLDEILGVGV